MSDYLSPATFQTKNAFQAEGPLGGFLAGMNQDIANQLVQRGMAKDDLARQKAEEELRLMSGTTDSKIAQEIANARLKGLEADRYNEKTDTAIASSKAITRGHEIKNDEDERTQAANLWVDFSNELKERGGRIDPMNQDDRDWYGGWHQKMSKYAPNMPPMLDSANTQVALMQGEKAKQFLAMKSQAALNNRSYQQDMAKVGAQGDNAARVAQIGADQRAYSAELKAASDKEVAEIRAQAAKDKEERDKTIVQAQLAQIRQIKKNGGIKDAEDFETVTSVARDQAMKDLASDPKYKRATATYTGNPVEASLMVEKATEDKAESLVSGYKKMKSRLLGGQSPRPSAVEAAKAPAPTSKGPEAGSVEDGYRFKGGNPADPKNWEKI